MKVALVGPYPEPGQPITGGVERVIDTLLPELRKHVELTLIVPGAARDMEGLSQGCRTLYLRRGPGPGVLRYWNVEAERLRRVVADLQPDVVHLHGLAGLGRRIGKPQILTVHGIAERDLLAAGHSKPWSAIARHGLAALMRQVEVSSRRHIGNVIVISPYVTEVLPDVELLNRFPIPNAIDPAFGKSSADPTPARLRRIVSVGRINRRKNTLGVLELMARVMADDPSVTLSMCGEPTEDDYFEACRAFVATKGLNDRVRFPGTLTTPELISLLDASALLVQQSLQETAPVAVAEAQARGLPVLAPEAFGLRYMIEPGLNGFFLPGGTDANARVVHTALAHAWDRARMAQDARHRYGVDRVVRQTVAAYRAVVGMQASSPVTTAP